MSNFDRWDKEFRVQNLYAFNNDSNGILWLKVKAISRGRQMDEFLTENNISLTSEKIADKNEELFHILENRDDASSLLDHFLKVKSHNWYESKGIDDAKLKDDLYKVQYYAWGGDQNNSLDKYLVSHYVKEISVYDELVSKTCDIAANAWNYVQTSWYNNWTSYLIESLFKKHFRVTSAVGEIKSVDFFIDDYPVDLKVTYFPNQYMESKLKEKLGKKELSWLKGQAKKHSISFNTDGSESQQLYSLMEKLSDAGHLDLLEKLKDAKKQVIEDAQLNKEKLMEWLYANQGEMRFGAENRIFVILVDSSDLQQSWKMKRAFNLIEPKINDYLNNFNEHSLKPIQFNFKKSAYVSLADIIFVVK